MKNSATPLALSPREAAKALGIAERTLWSATQPRGPIPAIKLGKRVLYPVDGLKEWLSNAIQEDSSMSTSDK